MRWNNGYNEAVLLEARERARVYCVDPSLAVQSGRDEADINVLVRRFGIGEGPLAYVPPDPSYYGDFSDVPDLRTALEVTMDAREKFNALPAKVRDRFRNDPAELWRFVSDPENVDEAVRIGLLTRRDPDGIIAAPSTRSGDERRIGDAAAPSGVDSEASGRSVGGDGKAVGSSGGAA